jgi:hypothetical protein
MRYLRTSTDRLTRLFEGRSGSLLVILDESFLLRIVPVLVMVVVVFRTILLFRLSSSNKVGLFTMNIRLVFELLLVLSCFET